MADDLSISVSLRSFAADADDRDECTREDRDMLRAAADAIERLQDEIGRLRKERDEARRELCRNEAIIRLQRNRVHRDSEDVVGLAKEIAVERGWDCFKEVTDDR